MFTLDFMALALVASVSLHVAADSVASGNATADASYLKTWWHSTGEINWETPVQPGNVRQSHIYSTWVKSTADSSNTYYNSFVYETIPRNGQGQIDIPGQPSSLSSVYDSITIEEDLWMTTSWTQFLYSADSWIRVSRRGNNPANSSNVVIRPSKLGLTVTDDGQGSVYILVPYISTGLRFSVEFKDNLYTYKDSCDTTNCDFVQDWHPDGPYYVPSYNEHNPIMGIEPHDALLVFASPFPAQNLVPSTNGAYVAGQGLVKGLDTVTASTIIFQPGVYYMTGTAHATLSSSVRWVYLAPGAYVKGAIQFTTSSTDIKATGYGVLSGEQYVYQANKAQGYRNVGSNEDSLRMWEGRSATGIQQTFTLTGVTTNSPPFNSVDFRGDLDTIRIDQWDYKQVGAYFGQTDGVTLYRGSSVRDVFYHSNDDTIKTYGSDISVSNIVVWKGKTAPVVQFGWYSRSLSNITVDGIDVIHMKYSSNGSHPSIVGANQVYGISEDRTDTAVLSNTVKNVVFRNIRAEGIGGNLMRICPLANYENVLLENISLEQFSVRTNGIFRSEMPIFRDSSGREVMIRGFSIRNFSVGGTRVSLTAGNYGPNALGGLNIPKRLLDAGNVTIT